MEEIDKKTLEKHTQALNRVADALGEFLEGLPGFVSQLERNEALLQAKHERVKIRDQIAVDIDKYERKQKEKREKEKAKGQKKDAAGNQD